MIGDVETFGAELQTKVLREREGLQEREIDVCDARAAHHVAPFIPELSGLRDRIESLKG